MLKLLCVVALALTAASACKTADGTCPRTESPGEAVAGTVRCELQTCSG